MRNCEPHEADTAIYFGREYRKYPNGEWIWKGRNRPEDSLHMEVQSLDWLIAKGATFYASPIPQVDSGVEQAIKAGGSDA